MYIIVSRLSTLFLLWDHEFVMIFHVEVSRSEHGCRERGWDFLFWRRDFFLESVVR